jgi:hypothetical protein
MFKGNRITLYCLWLGIEILNLKYLCLEMFWIINDMSYEFLE